MSLSADVAVAAAERIEQGAGPAAGLAVWRRLAGNAAGAALRARAILGGLRCAIALREPPAIRELTRLWPTLGAVDPATWSGVFAACREMSRAHLDACAVELARSELQRARTARGLYAYARCLEVAADPRAAAAFGEALEAAEALGDEPLAHACRVRRAVWLARSSESLSAALDEAKRVDLAATSLAERFALARVMLRSPSRFVRATAIDLLDDVVRAGAGGGALARRAWTLAASHADDMNDELSPLEADRLVALFSREPMAKELSRARDAVRIIERLGHAKRSESDAALEVALDAAARLDTDLARLHQRARDILGGRFEPHDASSPIARPEWSALLDAAVGLRDAVWPRAARALGALSALAEHGHRLPPSAWTVAQAALGVDSAESPDRLSGPADVRAAAGRLVGALIDRAGAAPPRGWLGLAHALAAVRMDDLAGRAYRSAALANEAGATEALTLQLTRSGWRLALAGERAAALERLREARALARGPRVLR